MAALNITQAIKTLSRAGTLSRTHPVSCCTRAAVLDVTQGLETLYRAGGVDQLHSDAATCDWSSARGVHVQLNKWHRGRLDAPFPAAVTLPAQPLGLQARPRGQVNQSITVLQLWPTSWLQRAAQPALARTGSLRLCPFGVQQGRGARPSGRTGVINWAGRPGCAVGEPVEGVSRGRSGSLGNARRAPSRDGCRLAPPMCCIPGSLLPPAHARAGAHAGLRRVARQAPACTLRCLPWLPRKPSGQSICPVWKRSEQLGQCQGGGRAANHHGARLPYCSSCARAHAPIQRLLSRPAACTRAPTHEQAPSQSQACHRDLCVSAALPPYGAHAAGELRRGYRPRFHCGVRPRPWASAEGLQRPLCPPPPRALS